MQITKPTTHVTPDQSSVLLYVAFFALTLLSSSFDEQITKKLFSLSLEE